MSDLDEAMLQEMAHIVFSVGRPFCYHDFLRFIDFNGEERKMDEGTIRNKFSMFSKSGKIELEYRSRTAFYTIPGHRFGKRMTPDHAGVYNSKMDSFARFIYNLPTGTPAVHDIRIGFQVQGIWVKLSSVHPELRINQRSEDKRIQPWKMDGLLVRTTVHKSDTVSVIVACSLTPVTINFNGLIELSNTLTRVHERLNVVVNDVDYCHADQSRSNDYRLKSPDSIQHLKIPDPKYWVVKMWHFGVDSLNEYLGGKIDLEWKDVQHALIRVYTKKMKDKKTRIRFERQEYPGTTFQAVVEEKIGLGER